MHTYIALYMTVRPALRCEYIFVCVHVCVQATAIVIGCFVVVGAVVMGWLCWFLSREAIQSRNLLLRGCVLRNTPWVVGLVLNTGPDTKIIMSSMEVRLRVGVNVCVGPCIGVFRPS